MAEVPKPGVIYSVASPANLQQIVSKSQANLQQIRMMWFELYCAYILLSSFEEKTQCFERFSKFSSL
jgi:uncharacterized membrane protein (DUF485 family)